MFFISGLIVLLSVFTYQVTSRHGHTMRSGRLTNDEMRIVHSLMDGMEDDGDMGGMVMPDPPVNTHPARSFSDRCTLGSKSYCPGEVLFK